SRKAPSRWRNFVFAPRGVPMDRYDERPPEQLHIASLEESGQGCHEEQKPPEDAVVGIAGANGVRRKGPRARSEVEEERRQLYELTSREIDLVAAEFDEQIRKAEAATVGAIYARYSSRFQHSISDQVRTLYEAALKQGICVPREYVFFDMAVRGYKEQRPGLSGLRTVL